MAMKRPFTLLFLLMTVSAFAQLQPRVSDWSATYASHRSFLQQAESRGTLEEALDDAFDDYVAKSAIKGFNAAMLLPDGTVWKRASGTAQDYPVKTPLTTDHLMGMGSISKTFTAVALMMLIDEGQLSLTDSIGKFIPKYNNIDNKATIRQLLGHRTGFNDYLNENPATLNTWFENRDSIWSADTLLTYYIGPPNFNVNRSFSYSNTNYLIAGKIIEKVSGKPWYTVVREKILDPLKLTNTFIYPYELPGTLPFANAYSDTIGNGQMIDLQGSGFPLIGLFSMADAAGCLISKPEDIARFMEQLLSGKLLSLNMYTEMLKDNVLVPGAGLKYGLGVLSFDLPQKVIGWGHNGSIIYQSIAMYFPSQKVSIAVQQNDVRQDDGSGAIFDQNYLFLDLLDAFLKYSPSTSAGWVDAGTRVYPNPVLNEVVLEKTNGLIEGPVLLRDLQGRLIQQYNSETSILRMELGGLSPGVYFLHWEGKWQKLVKQ